MTSGWPGTAFHISTSDAVLADLRGRLVAARLPLEQAGPDWQAGTPIGYARRLQEYWLSSFDWHGWEAFINGFDQRLVQVSGQTIHVIVERGSGANPLPLIMTHGWPGSFVEFIGLIDQLAHPERHGGREEDAFTVVIPSLPGYGFSPAPAQPVSPTEIAELWSLLMTESFGFSRYVAYGSDWGSMVTASLALNFPKNLAAILITTPGLVPAIDASVAPLTSEELDWQQRAHATMLPESAYQLIQATKSQSLAYGHTDSPIALACWLIEKFQGWSVPGDGVDPPFSMDVLLANVMLYWLNGAVAPMWLYIFLDKLEILTPGQRVKVPAGFLLAPRDLLVPAPKCWLERSFDVAHYVLAESGGHFPGLDNGNLLVKELSGFLGSFR